MSSVTLTPMLSFPDAAAAIAFYEEAFGAVETERITEPNGKIGHAALSIGDAEVLLSDEYPEIGVLSPSSVGGSPVMLLLQVPDVDAIFAQAVAAGATIDRPVSGDVLRNGKLIDPFGHRWMILTKK